MEGYSVDIVLRFVALGPPFAADCAIFCETATRSPAALLISHRPYR